MAHEPPPAPEACLAARDLFPRALEDPSAEEEILLHARGCLECMDAFLELKDTVKKLEAAASEIPDTGSFSTRVLDAIDREAHSRGKRARPLAILGVSFLAGLAVALAAYFLVPGRAQPTPAGATEPQAGNAANGTPVAKTPAREESGEAGRPETGPHPEPPAGDPESEAVEEILRAFEALELEPPEAGPGPRPGRFPKMRPIMARAAQLDRKDRQRLIARLEEGGEGRGFPPRRRMREEIIKRLKAMQDKGLRSPTPDGEGSEKK